jgi:hypothetical protein
MFQVRFPPAQTNQAFAIGGLVLLETSGTGPTTFVLTRATDTRADGSLSLGRLGVLNVPDTALKLAGSLYCCYPDAGPRGSGNEDPPIFIHQR